MSDPVDDRTRTLSSNPGPKPEATTGTAPSPFGSGTIVDGLDDGPSSAAHSFQLPGYVVSGELARGGMGAVFLARDTELLRDVAIKVLQDRFDKSGDVASRFVEEARITGQLQHPGIPPVHELGTLPD